MNIQYVDTEWIRVLFSTLVVNAASLVKYDTSIKDFIQDDNIKCKTNGKIIVIYEMMSSHPFLSELATSHLGPLGLKHYKDFIFLQEPMTMGVEGRPSLTKFDQELEGTIDIPWLSSVITKDGCFVSKAS